MFKQKKRLLAGTVVRSVASILAIILSLTLTVSGNGHYAILPFILAGASLIGQGINASNQTSANKASLKFQEAMYNRQRTDALSDWNMQNQYNSPEAQMERYKQAGLNPNLIYGQSNQAPAVRSSSAGDYKPQAPRYDLGGIVEMFMQGQMMQIQQRNTEAAIDLKKKELEVKELALKLGNQKYYWNEMNAPTALELQRERVNATKQNILFSTHEDARKSGTYEMDVATRGLENKRIQEQVNYLREQIANQPILRQKMNAEIERIAALNGLVPDQKRQLIMGAWNLMQNGDLKQFELNQLKNGLTKPILQQVIDGIKDVVVGRLRK